MRSSRPPKGSDVTYGFSSSTPHLAQRRARLDEPDGERGSVHEVRDGRRAVADDGDLAQDELGEHEGPQPGPINLGNPVELTVSELVEVILDLTGSGSGVVHRPLPADDPRRRRPDIAKADAVLDWRPTTALLDGLRRTINWFDADRPIVVSNRPALSA